MSQWSTWIRESFALTVGLVRHCFFALAFLFGTATAFSIWTEDAMQLAGLHGEQRWDLQIALGLMEMAVGVTVLLALVHGVSQVRTVGANLLQKPYSSPYLGSFFAEYLRMLAQVLLYSLLLLLPGFYRYCQLIFVPFVAIRASERLVQGRFKHILAAVLVPTVLSGALEYAPQMSESLHDMPVRILFNTLSDLTSVWGFALLYLMFESAMKETNLEDL
jgi:hypothetical protein